MVHQEKIKVIANDRIAKNYFKLVFGFSKISFAAVPGQFVSIRISDTCDPFLRRPFSIHRLVCGGRLKTKAIEILYESVGRGTEILSQKKRGEYLDMLGPLGNGFRIKSQVTSHKSQVLIAGGMGVAPLVFLAEKLRVLKTQNSKLKVMVLIGAKNKNQILCEKEFRDLGCEVKIATDDGSKGFKGRITELLQSLLTTRYSLLTTIYACGPKLMLKQIASISKCYNIPAQISLEAHMACGLGACLGCVVKTTEGFKRVCKDGPVFNAQEIIWEG